MSEPGVPGEAAKEIWCARIVGGKAAAGHPPGGSEGTVAAVGLALSPLPPAGKRETGRSAISACVGVGASSLRCRLGFQHSLVCRAVMLPHGLQIIC